MDDGDRVLDIIYSLTVQRITWYFTLQCSSECTLLSLIHSFTTLIHSLIRPAERFKTLQLFQQVGHPLPLQRQHIP